MSKRKMLSAIGKESNVKKNNKHWSLGLIESMNDPKHIYKETDRVVVIKDKYPKAKIHYLMLPRDNIESIHKLNKKHISILKEFGSILQDIIEENKDVTLKAGFHAVPSMQRLHMHIISTDMVSPCLRTKIHWNSFTTDFFIPYEDVLRKIEQNGHIEVMSTDLHKSLLATKLKCNKCSYVPRNMPQLRKHLAKHVQYGVLNTLWNFT
ncbi:aprataxin [Epargyreus clarus]|uniref:aprataxin n=1 Tax=Epargyreus clarus TaxID=520877 RepID=UPI003C302531